MDIKHEAQQVKAYFACEREMWHGDGETEHMVSVHTAFTVHLTREEAEQEANQWREEGYHATVTGPHPTGPGVVGSY